MNQRPRERVKLVQKFKWKWRLGQTTVNGWKSFQAKCLRAG